MGKTFVVGCIVAIVSCAPPDVAEPPPSHSNPTPVATDRPEDSVPAADAAETPDDDLRGSDAAATLARTTGTTPTPKTPAASDRDAVLASTHGAAAVRTHSINQCEQLRAEIKDDGRRRFRRIRKTWTKADQKRFAQLVSLVAKEMGADPRLIKVWAMRESTYRPQAMHVLNPDVEAALASWRRFRYSAQEERELVTSMEQMSKQDPDYWKAKARLHQVQTFRDNPYLDEIVEFAVVTADGEHSMGSEPAWAFGYGPFGFNPSYFVPVWDSSAPPWVFCDDDGLVAIITAVWSARTSQRECEAQGFGDSYATVNRRFSRGHCAHVGPNANFRKRAARLGIDPDARAKLGRKWQRRDTDRSAILKHMRGRAVQAGLLPPRPHRAGA